MDWRENLERILRLDEQEIALWESLAAAAPNEATRRMIRRAIAREREEMRTIRELIMGKHMDV